VVAACSVVGPPNEPEYPALRMPMRLPAPAANKPAASGAAKQAVPASGSAPPAAADAVETRAHGDLPDPPALSERAQWIFEVIYDRGDVRVGDPSFKCFGQAQATPRRMGRFAFELWLGHELIERSRFDFPLLASETPRSGSRQALREVPSFAPGARVAVTLSMPASQRATRARILDRATGDSVAVPWPPRAAGGVTPNSCRAPQTSAHVNAD
jgi:hypothetical protein